MLIWTARQLPSVNKSGSIHTSTSFQQIEMCMRPYKIYYTCSISSDRLLQICLHNNIIGGCTITFSFIISLEWCCFRGFLLLFFAFTAAGRSRLNSRLTRCEVLSAELVQTQSFFDNFSFEAIVLIVCF